MSDEAAQELAKLASSTNLSSKIMDALIDEHLSCFDRLDEPCGLCDELVENGEELARLLLENPALSAAQQKLVLDKYLEVSDQEDTASMLSNLAGNPNISDHGKELVLDADYYQHWTWEDPSAIEYVVSTVKRNARFTKEEARTFANKFKE